MDDRGLLSGIRVIDCGTYVAGPASATVCRTLAPK